MNLEDRREMRELMNKFGITAQKKYGQNFLTDEGVLDEIIESSNIDLTDTVLEIGPGLGTLTKRLAKAAQRVVAVEIDSSLIPVLSETLSEHDNITLINEDILKCDVRALINEYSSGNVRVVANLPYYITTPIVLELLKYCDVIKSITIMIQKEVAQRMQANPGSKDYGALSLAVQYYSKPTICCEAPAECFFPMPGVDSVVINLETYDVAPVETKNPDKMFKIIRAAFNMRRKTLPNSLASGGLGYTREQVENALLRMGLSKTIRGEVLTLEQFAILADELS